ncbi:MAG: TIGR01548 family HAD-type hydrolase [Bradymonadia bacterium]
MWDAQAEQKRVVPGPALGRISRYRVPGHPAPIDLDLRGNEGPAPEPELLRALNGPEGTELLRRYPSAVSLERRLAEGWGLSPEQVAVTAGADDGLDRICRAMMGPGRRMICPTPGFVMTPRAARLAGGEVVELPWREALPVEAILQAAEDEQVCVLVLTSPNNPTGAVITEAQLRRLAAELPARVLIVLDVAYGEFADIELRPVALSLPRVLVVGTFSKAWGLAGLRVGHVAGPAEYVGWVKDVGLPYAVSGPALALAEAALDRGDEPVRAHAAAVKIARGRIEAAFESVGAAVTRGEGNFVFARTPKAAWIADAMAGLGIGVRAFPGRSGLEDALRIACPTEAGDIDRVCDGIRTAVRPEAILFDLDGVLADVSASYRVAIVETAAHFGVHVTAADVAEVKAAGDANNDWKVTQRLLQRAGVQVDLDAIIEVFEGLYQGTPQAPGLRRHEALTVSRTALAGLAERVPLAVVTGRPRDDARAFLEGMEIAQYFQAVVCMEDGPAKPDPAPVRVALEALGVRRAWMLGDTPDDVRAARGAGVVPVGVVAPGEGDPEGARQALLGSGAARVIDEAAAVVDTLSRWLEETP